MDMKYEVTVDPVRMEHMMNTNMRQIILDAEDLDGELELLVVTDGTRLMLCKPTALIECYFEDKKVTIKEKDEYVPYLWTDNEVVNIAFFEGLQTGDMLKEKIKRFGKHLVIRW